MCRWLSSAPDSDYIGVSTELIFSRTVDTNHPWKPWYEYSGHTDHHHAGCTNHRVIKILHQAMCIEQRGSSGHQSRNMDVLNGSYGHI